MKKLIVILGFLIAAAGAGIYFLLPTNINWDSRRLHEAIAAEHQAMQSR